MPNICLFDRLLIAALCIALSQTVAAFGFCFSFGGNAQGGPRAGFGRPPLPPPPLMGYGWPMPPGPFIPRGAVASPPAAVLGGHDSQAEVELPPIIPLESTVQYDPEPARLSPDPWPEETPSRQARPTMLDDMGSSRFRPEALPARFSRDIKALEPAIPATVTTPEAPGYKPRFRPLDL